MISINKDASTPYYLQLKNQLKDLIVTGVLKPDTKLPPTRKLSDELDINRNTVLTAYEELEADGYVYSHVGQGTFVAGSDSYQDKAPLPAAKKFNWSNSFSTNFDEIGLFSMVQLYRISTSKVTVAFGGGVPADDLYPLQLIKRCFNAAVHEEKKAVFNYGPTEGYSPLREFIAKKVKGMGIDARLADIFITNGSQQAMQIAARILIDPGDYVITEEPTYTGALGAFTTLKAKILGVPMQKDGMNTEALESMLLKYNPKVIYTVPNFHNPTGITMSLEKRKRLMYLAERHNVPIIEDDANGDLRFEHEELPSLKSLDRTSQVIYITSWSKSLIPGFRVGYAIINESLLHRFTAFKQMEDLATNTISQAIIYKFYSRGYFKTHLKKIRKKYRERRDTMIRCIKKYFPVDVEFTKPEGGLYLWIKFPENMDLTPVFQISANHGVLFSLGTMFYSSKKGKNEMRLSYAPNPSDKIEEGMKIIGSSITKALEMKKEHIKELDMIPLL
jgi:DNA-binding transcriptional MocR family regulator